MPVPFAATLESAWLPSRERITEHVLKLVGGAAPQPVGSDRAQQPA